MTIPLEIYISIINISLIFIIVLGWFYIQHLKTYKNLFIWIALLFFINLLTIRFVLKNYLKNSIKDGEKGKQGSKGISGLPGDNKCCGDFNDPNDLNKLKELKKSVNKWSTLLLSYKEGPTFLKDYFFIDYSWKDLIEKPTETMNPFDIIKTDPNWPN
jgi:hypothetical protein